MFKNFFPSKILSLDNKLINGLLFLMISIVLVGLVYALFISQPDYIQGDAVRIMYVHVPSSFIALGCFGFIGIASILNLIFRIKFVSLMAKSLAPVGCIFSLISIVTGSLWGKPTWGIWWVWDARLTSMVILFLFYLAYIFTWQFVNDFERANKITSIIGIIGLFNLPVIKYSVDWWNTLHQSSSITLTSAPTIHYTMLVPLIIMFLGMVIYSLIIFLMRYKTELMKLKLHKKNKNN
jgi:heme exporter protein C